MQTKRISIKDHLDEEKIIEDYPDKDSYPKEDRLLKNLQNGGKTYEKVGTVKVLFSEFNNSVLSRSEKRNKHLAETLIAIWKNHTFLPLRNEIIFCLSYVDHKLASNFIIHIFEGAEKILKRNTHKKEKELVNDAKSIKDACVASMREHLKIINEALASGEIPEDKLDKYKKAKIKIEGFFKTHKINSKASH